MRPLFTRVEFSWKVASNGYTLSPPHSDEGHETELQGRIVPLRGPTHQTKPFDKFPGLFRQFAAMEATPSGALHFANKFGLLQAEEPGSALTVWLEQRAHFAELVVNSDTPSSNGRRADALNSLNHILRSQMSTEISAVGGIVVKPHSLLAAMAFQLGLWFEVGDNRIGQCAECGTTWEFGPGTGHRVNRRYCSMKCQEAAYYRRKKKRRGAFWRQQGGQ